MVKDIPEKPAPGDEPQPETAKKTNRKIEIGNHCKKDNPFC